MVARTHHFDKAAHYLVSAKVFVVVMTCFLALFFGQQEAVSGFIGGNLFWLPHVAFAFVTYRSLPKPVTAASDLMRGQAIMILMTIALWMCVLTSECYIHVVTLISYGLCWLVLPLWGIWRYA